MWWIGVLLIVAGVGWIVLRVVIERGAQKGSWFSHSVKQVSVIGQLPLIGLLWRLLPFLMIAAGIAWLAGYRPFGLGRPSHPAAPAPPPTRCGDPAATPSQVPASEWSSYRCKTQAQAGAAWTRCLSQTQYAGPGGAGCPGTARCCPP
jgi:hypothetical protein